MGLVCSSRTHLTALFNIQPSCKYDANITKMKLTPNNSTTSENWKDFLALPPRNLGDRTNRVARLVMPWLLPQPQSAMLRDGFLTWTWYSDERDGTRKSPSSQAAPPQLCFAFVQLVQASDEDIRLFAERWGPLNRHKRQVESVKSWRHYARLAEALMRFTGQLTSGGRGEEKDWAVICSSTPLKGLELHQLNEPEQMAVVAAAVNIWFAEAHQHGILTMVDDDLQVSPHASNLFGLLITQIAHVIARSDQTVKCAGCGNPFKPRGPITRGVRQYCKGCRKSKKPQRDAARDWRQRAREKEGSVVQPSDEIVL